MTRAAAGLGRQDSTGTGVRNIRLSVVGAQLPARGDRMNEAKRVEAGCGRQQRRLVTQLIEYGERSTKNGETPKSWNLTPSGLDDTSPTAQRTGADS